MDSVNKIHREIPSPFGAQNTVGFGAGAANTNALGGSGFGSFEWGWRGVWVLLGRKYVWIWWSASEWRHFFWRCQQLWGWVCCRAKPAFGGGAAGGFGSNASSNLGGFGNSSTGPSVSSFGNNSSGGAFGGGASSGFGSGGAGGFGRSNTTMQGLDTLASGGLGRSSPQQSAFGQQPKTQVGAFGGASSGFGSGSSFGQSSTGGFGSTNSGGFGSSNSAAPVSGGFGQSNGGAFGQSPGGLTGGLQGTGSPFGAQNQQQNAFGATACGRIWLHFCWPRQ